MVELNPSQKASARFLEMSDEEYLEQSRLIDLSCDTLAQVRALLVGAIEQMGDKRPGRFAPHLDIALTVVDDGLRCGDCGARPGNLHVSGCDVERCKVCGWQAIGCDCPSPQGEYASTLEGTFGDWKSTIWTGLWPGYAEMKEYGYADLNDLATACARGELTWDSERERWVK